MTVNPNYSHDEDDDFDSTYANFYYKLPEQYLTELRVIFKDKTVLKPSEKWQILFNAMAKEEVDKKYGK